MKKGFTLVEIMVSTTIFLLVMTISMGAIYAVFDANHRAQSEKTVMDNLNLSVEEMSREMRFGTNYHCGRDLTNLTVPQNCSSGGTVLAFTAPDRSGTIVYRQNGTRIERSTDAGATFTAVTAPEMTIQSIIFAAFGAAPGDGLQPRVFILLTGYAQAGAKASSKTTFVIQTLVSQRVLDH